jgi:uncharacterized protein (UPF0261 family)
LKGLADHLAEIMKPAKGPVSFFVPLGGFSNHDSPDGHIHDPSLPPPFADYVQGVMPANVEVHRVDAHFNDVAFADAVIAKARAYLQR